MARIDRRRRRWRLVGAWALALGSLAAFPTTAAAAAPPATSVGASPPAPLAAGYWVISTDGGVFSFGGAGFFGSAAPAMIAPAVGLASTPTGKGYWVTGLDGEVMTFGDAGFFGAGVGSSAAPVVGLAPTPSGQGYWLVATDGGVFSHGDAGFFGSGAGVSTAPVVSLVATPSGHGYWLLSLEGGVLSFGDALFFGSAAHSALAPVVSMTPTPSGRGYWLVSTDGGVFAFGDAGFFGSAVGVSQTPVAGLLPTPSGRGYWLVSTDGGVFAFGDAGFFGSAVGNSTAPFVGLTRPGGPPSMGGWLVAAGSPATDSPGAPVAALTFDDGPDPSHTLGILDILSRYRVPATFFLMGIHAVQYQDLVREEVRRGNSVQNHTWTHPMLTWLDSGSVGAQIDMTEAYVKGLAGVAPRCLRPPYGAHDAATDQIANGRGLHVVMWNDDPQDWTWISADEIVRRVMAQLQPVSVILFHDRTHVIDALPTLITMLRARGYRFATICQASGATPGSSL